MTTVLLGAPNFRDLGGLKAADGRIVGHRRLLRSGQLGELHGEDIALLRQEFGGDLCVIDLRGASERIRRPCLLHDATVHSLPIEPSVAQRLDAVVESGEPLNAAIAHRFMVEAYGNFVRNARAQLGAFFSHAIARGGRPLLVHCTAGKDRTGFTIAILLGALGVSRRDIMEDYLLTRERVVPREAGRYPAEVLFELGTVRPEYLQAAFDTVDSEFGGLAAYLRTAAALDPERRQALRAALLTS